MKGIVRNGGALNKIINGYVGFMLVVIGFAVEKN
jgi:hypothetical protein